MDKTQIYLDGDSNVNSDEFDSGPEADVGPVVGVGAGDGVHEPDVVHAARPQVTPRRHRLQVLAHEEHLRPPSLPPSLHGQDGRGGTLFVPAGQGPEPVRQKRGSAPPSGPRPAPASDWKGQFASESQHSFRLRSSVA